MPVNTVDYLIEILLKVCRTFDLKYINVFQSWLTKSVFDSCVQRFHSEDLFKDTADRLAEDGWKELGYEYVIIDDCWMSLLRDEHGRLQPEPSRLVTLFWSISIHELVRISSNKS